MAKVTLFFFLTMVDTKVNAQFLEQPMAGIMSVPVSHRVTLSCTVAEGNSIDWNVAINNGEPIRASRRIHEATFKQHNITFTGVETGTSTLTFGIEDEMGNQTNNATTITCVAREGISERVPGNTVLVIFYDPPPPPTDLNVTEDELGAFNISWSLRFIGGVPVNYTLTVLNLNATSAQPIIIAGLPEQYYMFQTSRPCDVYSFTVTAVTAAGESTPSQEIIFKRRDRDTMCSTSTSETIATATTDSEDTTSSSRLDPEIIAGSVVGVIATFIVTLIIITLICWVILRRPNAKYSVAGAGKYCCNCFDTAKPSVSATTSRPADGISDEEANATSGPPNDISEEQFDTASAIPQANTMSESPEANTMLSLQTITTSGSPQTNITSESTQATTTLESPNGTNDEVLESTNSNIPSFRLLKTIDHDDSPIGLTSSKRKIFVQGSKGITVYQDLDEIKFMTMEEDHLTEITVHEDSGNIYVTTSQTCLVLKLNSEGGDKESASLKDLNGSSEFLDGLCINDDELWVCDNKSCKILILDLNLNYLRTITGDEKGGQRFDQPRDLESDSQNCVYIAENKRIQVLSQDGSFVRMIGEGELDDISAVKIFNDFIFAVDKNGVSLFSTSGKRIKYVYENTNPLFKRPLGIAISTNGYVYVSTIKEKLLVFELTY